MIAINILSTTKIRSKSIMKNQVPDYIYLKMIETLKELEKDGLVELKGETVKVLDYSGLQSLADKLDEKEGLKNDI
jgi:DNA-binding HxlR family transcriptional regulator